MQISITSYRVVQQKPKTNQVKHYILYLNSSLPLQAHPYLSVAFTHVVCHRKGDGCKVREKKKELVIHLWETSRKVTSC